MPRNHPAFFIIYLLLLAPIGAVVLIAALLLFGVEPRVVFAPGNALKFLFEVCGVQVANRVAVVSTVLCYWIVFAAVGFVWEARRGSAALRTGQR
ncbi:MAG TPA: hypothetical protein VK648_06805 [Gemmatimonadaceae bacterium]|nr:MAG: hypothetical protein DMF56_14880 [Acidobacteriota bacterium]HTD83485.1 hypothetical protein [Gemmatimonadaceae bacterium]